MNRSQWTDRTWTVHVDRKRYLIRETLPHYEGVGEVVCRGFEFKEQAAIAAAAPRLLEALRGVTRTLEAFSYTTTLGKTQRGRLYAARTLLDELEPVRAASQKAHARIADEDIIPAKGAERQAHYILERLDGDYDRAIADAGSAMNADEVQAVLRKWKAERG